MAYIGSRMVSGHMTQKLSWPQYAKAQYTPPTPTQLNCVYWIRN